MKIENRVMTQKITLNDMSGTTHQRETYKYERQYPINA